MVCTFVTLCRDWLPFSSARVDWSVSVPSRNKHAYDAYSPIAVYRQGRSLVAVQKSTLRRSISTSIPKQKRTLSRFIYSRGLRGTLVSLQHTLRYTCNDIFRQLDEPAGQGRK